MNSILSNTQSLDLRRSQLRFMRAVMTIAVAATCVVAKSQELRVPFNEATAARSQADWSKDHDVPLQLTNSLGMKLTLIPPGRFTMGPNGSTYQVTLSKPFYIGCSEVTLGEYRHFRKDHCIADAEDQFNSADRPAAMVNWDDAREFCKWLGLRPEEREAGRVYSLPTEAQWEWAARAGTATTRFFGDDDKSQEEYSWFNHTYTANPKHESGDRGRQVVRQLKPNAWGLYDMLGNVWEWCDDRRIDEATGEVRQPVMRGGSWRSGAFHCTAVAHDPADPRTAADHIGFRVVCRIVANCRD